MTIYFATEAKFVMLVFVKAEVTHASQKRHVMKSLIYVKRPGVLQMEIATITTCVMVQRYAMLESVSHESRLIVTTM